MNNKKIFILILIIVGIYAFGHFIVKNRCKNEVNYVYFTNPLGASKETETYFTYGTKRFESRQSAMETCQGYW